MDKSEKHSLDDEERGFEIFFKKLKYAIFDVLAILEQDEENGDGIFLFYLQTAADYVQMHSFPFNQKVDQVWKANSFLQIIFTAFNVLSIGNYLPSVNYITFILSVYFLLVVILLMILDIIYVSYSFSRKRFAVMWPLYVLQKGVSLVVTVFFLPITETLISMITCTTVDEKYSMVLFPEVVCWQGWHIFHAFLACIFNLIFTLICSIVAYAFFEPRMGSKNRTARSDSNAEVVFILNKVICQLLYSFLSEESSWILTVITFILACWLFKVYNVDDPYYDWEVGLFYNIISTYYLWTCSWLVICKILETTSFNGGLIAWLLGLPFIVSIMLSTKKSKIDMLLRSQNKFKSGEEINNHIRYVLQLIQNQNKDKNSYMLLMGYIEKHKETCQKLDECQLLEKNNRKLASHNVDLMIEALIIELEKVFVLGLEKFPQSTQLRISYAYFLMDRKNNYKKKALQQFVDAQKYGRPSFDQEFIIYRNSKSINQSQKDKEENSDMIQMIEFENHMNQCDDMMKLSANLHKEFWIELKEDQPDLRKLNILGQRINKATGSVKESYAKMQKINPEIYSSIRVYGLFLLYILNDKFDGKQNLRLANLKRDLQRQNQQEIEAFVLENDIQPVITVSMVKKNGIIVSMNQLVVNLLGYSKQELVGKPITNLMPQVYGQYHNYYFQECWDAIKQNQFASEYINKEQINYFKHKSGCIIQIQYKVMINLELLQYYVQFKAITTEKNLIHLLMDNHTKIKEFSSSAMNIFGLDTRIVNNTDIYFKDFIPDILVNSAQKDLLFRSYIKQEERSHYFRKEIKQLNIRMVSDTLEQQGFSTDHYAVILEIIEKAEAKISSKRSVRPSVDILKINPGYSANAQTSSQLFSNVIINQNDNSGFNNLMTSFWLMPKQEEIDQVQNYISREERTIIVHEVQFDDSIKTRRLINNQIVPIDEEDNDRVMKELQEEEQEDSIFKNKNEFQLNKKEYQVFAKQKQQITIVKALNTKHQHKEITRIKNYTFFYLIFFIVIALLQYFDKYTFINDQEQILNSMQKTNLLQYHISSLLSSSIDHLLTKDNMSLYTQSEIQNDVNYAVKSVSRLFLEINQYSLLNEQLSNTDILYSVHNHDGTEVNTTIKLQQAIRLIVSNGILFTNVDRIELEIHELQSIIKNYYFAIENEFFDITQYFLDLGFQQTLGLTVYQIILIIVTIIVGIGCIIVFILLMIQIKVQRENIMFLFLAIPEHHLINFQKSCEYFIKQSISIKELIEKQNEMEMSSDEEDVDDDVSTLNVQEEYDIEHLRKQSQKYKKVLAKYQSNVYKGQVSLILSIIIMGLILLSNSTYQLYDTQYMKGFMNLVWPQYQLYQGFSTHYIDHLNLYSLMMINSDQKIDNRDIKNLTQENLMVFKNNQELLREFSVEVFDQFPEFTEIYNTVQYFMICDPIRAVIGDAEYDKCSNYMNTTIFLGVIAVEQYMYQFFERRQRIYLNLTESFTNSEALKEPLLYEISYSLFNYIGFGINYMIEFEKELIISKFNSSLSISLIITLIYILFIFLFYFIIVYSYLNKMNQETNQTIQMLNMIPIDVIKQNKNLRDFVIKLIKLMDEQVYK